MCCAYMRHKNVPAVYSNHTFPFLLFFQRFGVGFGFSLIYSALLTKTNRISRIFDSASRSARRPGFISPKSQVIITWFLVSIQVSSSLYAVLSCHYLCETKLYTLQPVSRPVYSVNNFRPLDFRSSGILTSTDNWLL